MNMCNERKQNLGEREEVAKALLWHSSVSDDYEVAAKMYFPPPFN